MFEKLKIELEISDNSTKMNDQRFYFQLDYLFYFSLIT